MVGFLFGTLLFIGAAGFAAAFFAGCCYVVWTAYSAIREEWEDRRWPL